MASSFMRKFEITYEEGIEEFVSRKLSAPANSSSWLKGLHMLTDGRFCYYYLPVEHLLAALTGYSFGNYALNLVAEFLQQMVDDNICKQSKDETYFLYIEPQFNLIVENSFIADDYSCKFNFCFAKSIQ